MNLFELPVWPAADYWPMLTDTALDALIADIDTNGLIAPVAVWTDPDGTTWLVDGRNRREACRQADIEPDYVELHPDTDPDSYVLSANEHRRHATPSQRAIAIAPLVEVDGTGTRTDLRNFAQVDLDQAADRAGVSKRMIEYARYVLDTGPQYLIDAVRAGTIAVKAAADEARRLEGQGQYRLAEIRAAVAGHPDLWEKWQTLHKDDDDADQVLREIEAEIADRRVISNAPSDDAATAIMCGRISEMLDTALELGRKAILEWGAMPAPPREQWLEDTRDRINQLRDVLKHLEESEHDG